MVSGTCEATAVTTRRMAREKRSSWTPWATCAALTSPSGRNPCRRSPSFPPRCGRRRTRQPSPGSAPGAPLSKPDCRRYLDAIAALHNRTQSGSSRRAVWSIPS